MSAKKAVEEKKLCIVCQREPAVRRGLCKQDYGRFRRRKDALETEQEREEFEAMAVEKGLILSDARSVEDPFAALAEEVRKASIKKSLGSKPGAPDESDSQKIGEDAAAFVRDLDRREGAKKKTARH